MKPARLFRNLLVLCLTAVAMVACYNDTELKSDIADLKGRMETIEGQMRTANGNISTLDRLVRAAEGKVYINSVTETADGYTISFSDDTKATITNGKSPVISVARYQGAYYWTLDGHWLLDPEDNMLPVSGKDAIAPQVKIDGGYWYVSADGGSTWTQLGKATGEDGDSVFKSVSSDASFWIFALANGDTIKISRGIHGAKSVTAIPDMSDGSVKATQGEFSISFDVLPAEAAAGLAGESDGLFTLKVVYTATKASGSLTLPILSKEGKDGTLLLKFDGSGLDDSFFGGISGASACLQIVQGDNVLSSGYFPLYYDPTNGYEYVDLGLPSGLKWAARNVGAANPENDGEYFAWGETVLKSAYSWSTYKFGTSASGPFSKYAPGDNKTVLDLEDDAAHVNMGGNWRMPTKEEWTELIDNCTWTDKTVNIVRGKLVTGPNGNSIFLPFAGYIDDTYICEMLSAGYYWSSSLAYNPSLSHYAYLQSSDIDIYDGSRFHGGTVRAVCSEFFPVSAVSLDNTSLGMHSGDKKQLTATVRPSNATAKDVRWASSDESVAKVDKDGLVTAVAEGTATITAYGSSGVSASCTVSVKAPTIPNGHEYVDLGLPSGLRWATMNVGATKPEGYGSHFAWGETKPKTDYSWSAYKFRTSGDKWDNVKFNKYCTQSSYWESSSPMDNKTVLDLEDDAARVNWGGTWRMPTNDEWKELTGLCSSVQTSLNGVKGYRFTGPNSNSIFIPFAGRKINTDYYGDGDYFYCWSSSLGTDSYSAWSTIILFVLGWSENSRNYGFSVRPVTD